MAWLLITAGGGIHIYILFASCFSVATCQGSSHHAKVDNNIVTTFTWQTNGSNTIKLSLHFAALLFDIWAQMISKSLHAVIRCSWIWRPSHDRAASHALRSHTDLIHVCIHYAPNQLRPATNVKRCTRCTQEANTWQVWSSHGRKYSCLKSKKWILE